MAKLNKEPTVKEIAKKIKIPLDQAEEINTTIYSVDNISSLDHVGGDYLTERDLITMILLYRLKPVISNVRDFIITLYLENMIKVIE